MGMCVVTFSLNVDEHVMAGSSQGRPFQSTATRGKTCRAPVHCMSDNFNKIYYDPHWWCASFCHGQFFVFRFYQGNLLCKGYLY